MNEQKIVERMELARALEVIAAASGDKEKYKKYFDEKLEKYKVKSPSELSDDQKKKFFEEVDTGWEADDEADMAGPKVGKVVTRRGR